jgi:hypothetical protein
MTIVDLSSRIKPSKDFKWPNKVVTFKKFIEEIEMEEKFYDGHWAPFGSDTEGGLAYFSKTTDVNKLEEKVLSYLENLEGGEVVDQYYARWDIDSGYSILILYENYDSVFPRQENVLMVKCGAWMDDDNLPRVLEELSYLEDALVNKTWLIDDIVFDKENKEHMAMLEEFKKSVKLICFED